MTTEMNCLAGGGINLDWIGAKSYPTNGMSFEWDYDTDAYIVAFTFNSTNRGLIYVDMSSPQTVSRGVFGATIFNSPAAFSSFGVTATYGANNRSLTIVHVSYGFSDAYIMPLKNSTILP